jgi:O-antigen/teichoic acid export membrane protein
VLDSSVRRGFLSIFDQALVSGTNFATSVIIGRLCTKDQLGTYYLALSLVYFVRGIQEQIISAPYTVYCHRKQGPELDGYGGSLVVHQLGLTLLTLVGLFGLGSWLWTGEGASELVTVVWVLLGAAPCMLLREFVRHYAFAHFRMKSAIAIDLAVCCLQLGCLLVLHQLGWLNVTTVYCVIGFACAVACLIWFLAGGRRFRFERSRILGDWRENWAFGRWALAGQLVGCSTPYILPWLLAFRHGMAETGVLAACGTLVGIANMFVLGLSNFLSPQAAHAFTTGGIDRLRAVLTKTALLFGTLLGSFCLVAFFTGDWLAVAIYGDKYADAGPIIIVLALGMLANSMAITAGNGLWAVDLPQANFRADLSALVVTIAATVLLLPTRGALGAALAILLGSLAGAGVRTLILLRVMRSLQRETQLA